MKFLLLLLLLALFVGQSLYAQITIGDSYVFTKEQHDQIKKNLDDYRSLISRFDKISADFAILTEQYELIKTLRSNQDVKIKELEIELKVTKRDNMTYDNLLIQHNNLKLNYSNLQEEINKLNKQLVNSSKSVLFYKGKLARELQYSHGDRIFANIVWATMVSATLMVIYITIEDHWLHTK